MTYDAIEIMDDLICETGEISRQVPHPPERFGVSIGIGYRLQILREVRSALVKAKAHDLEMAIEEIYMDFPS